MAERIFKCRGHIERKRFCLRQRRLGIAIGIAVARHNILNAQIGRIVTANATLNRHRTRFQTRRVGQNARNDSIARMHTQALRRSILGQNEEIGLEARIERLDHAERTCRLIRTHHADGSALDDALDYGATVPARPRLNTHGNGVAIHDLALAATHDFVVAIVGYDIGAVLVELHATSQARTALAAHRSALVACAALMFVIAPHGASSLSIARPAMSALHVKISRERVAHAPKSLPKHYPGTHLAT